MARYGRSPFAETFTEWTLETIEGRVSDMRDSIIPYIQAQDNKFREETRYLDSILARVESLPREITEPITDSIAEGTENIVDAIDNAVSYLGGELSDIKWSLEQLNEHTGKILDVMLNSLDNESRQYFQQGVKGYNSNELDIAKERFEKALNADKTNSFVYQYLGFISVAQKNPELAIRNFELACKFAPDDYHKALALSHLARCKYLSNKYSDAAKLSAQAVELSKDVSRNNDEARFLFEYAGYCAKAGQTESSLTALRKAIKKDWMYFAITTTDKTFDPVRKEVNTLLEDLRAKEKSIAVDLTDYLKTSNDITNKLEISTLLEDLRAEEESIAVELTDEEPIAVKLTDYLKTKKYIADKPEFEFHPKEKGLPLSENVYDYISFLDTNIEVLENIFRVAELVVVNYVPFFDRKIDRYEGKERSIINELNLDKNLNKIKQRVVMKTAAAVGIFTGGLASLGGAFIYSETGIILIGDAIASGLLLAGFLGIPMGYAFGSIAKHRAKRDIKEKEHCLEEKLSEMRNEATTKKNELLNLVKKLKENYLHAYSLW